MKAIHFLSIRSSVGLLGIILIISLAMGLANAQMVKAEGSRDNLVGQPSTNNRPCTEWRTINYANILRRRTFFQVYVRQGEIINLGSSAMGVSSTCGGTATQGNIALWAPGQINNFSDSQLLYPNLPAPTFLCSSQSGKGHLTTRAQELAGPLPNTNGYDACTYTAPSTGVYWVAFFGPLGSNPAACDADCAGGTVDAPNTAASQTTGVSMWDITVRSADGTTTYSGRAFVDYLAQIMPGNGTVNQVFSTLYGVTVDGFKYQVNLNGIDPYGYVIYNNNVGYLTPEGVPLYHDLVSPNTDLSSPQGGVSLAMPTGKLFFSIPAAELPSTIVPVPQIPNISNVLYVGSAGGNSGYQGLGGDFTYLGNVGGITEIIISRDGVNFDPTNTQNRVLRSVSVAGSQTLHWDGLDNSGAVFPTGNNFRYKITLHAGEYHFPLLDVENSAGGPSLTLLNPPGGVCRLASCSTAFYDHRGYQTSAGTVGTVNVTLPGTTPPSPSFSDPVNGYDSLTQLRPFGNGTGTGFGNQKGLDVWSFYPSEVVTSTLNVVVQPARDLTIENKFDGYLEIGSQATYALHVSSMGSNSITRRVTVRFDVPVGLSYSSVNSLGAYWNCSYSAPTVSCWTDQDVPSGTSLADINVVMQVLDTAGTLISSTATVSVANGQDTVSSNNTSSNTAPVRQYDFGDLPNSYNITTLGQNGARHAVGNLYLGSAVAAENVAAPDANANSDVQDDGITRSFSTPWRPGNTVYVDAVVNGDGGYLVGWMDWNNDGTFNQPEDRVVFGSLPAGTHHLPITIPAGYVTGTALFSRFRLYAGVQDAPLPTGAKINGEVEDYHWGFSPTAVNLTGFSARPEAAWGGGLLAGLLLLAAVVLVFRRR